jgi:hypothetical protein
MLTYLTLSDVKFLKFYLFSFRREITDLLLSLKYFNGAMNVYFTSIVAKRRFDNRLRSGPFIELLAPTQSTDSVKNYHFNKVAHTCNILPLEIRSC